MSSSRSKKAALVSESDSDLIADAGEWADTTASVENSTSDDAANDGGAGVCGVVEGDSEENPGSENASEDDGGAVDVSEGDDRAYAGGPGWDPANGADIVDLGPDRLIDDPDHFSNDFMLVEIGLDGDQRMYAGGPDWDPANGAVIVPVEPGRLVDDPDFFSNDFMLIEIGAGRLIDDPDHFSNDFMLVEIGAGADNGRAYAGGDPGFDEGAGAGALVCLALPEDFIL